MNLTFGTDGIRGIANKQISANLAFFIGKALAIKLLKKQLVQPKIAIGKDTRVSSDMLVCALSAGVMSMGIDVLNIGLVTTPALSFLTKYTHSGFGVMITASHNPADYNGIKIFDNNGIKLSMEAERELSLIFENASNYLPGDDVGRMVCNTECVHTYLDFLCNKLGNTLPNNLSLALDCANGAGSKIIPYVFKTLVNRCECFNTDFDKGVINGECGSVNTERFATIVRNKFDFGFAFDGDADRLVVVLRDGQILSGEVVLFVLAVYLKQQNKLQNNRVVTTVLTNIGVENSLNALGIKTIRCDVGDRNVLEAMQKYDCNLGGEESGHIIFGDAHPTSDGALTGLMLLEALDSVDFDIQEYLKHLRVYDTMKLNIKVSERQKSKFKTNVLNNVISDLANELGTQGRLIVRPSGTESVIRVLVEGQDKTLMENISKRLEQIILRL